ncbi:hypothetical protein R0K17_19295, partial [Planococcus sp. SIMBA_143]
LYASELTDQSNFDNSISIVDKEVNTTLSTSIRYGYTKEVPVDGYLPEKSWTTYNGYSGYVYRVRYELTRNNTWKGTYSGTLYKNVAPVKNEDER